MPVKFDKNKIVEDLKKGFQDIQTVAQEGNVKLFVKQFVAVLVVFLLFRYCNGKFSEKIANYNGQMEAIRVQQTSEQEYQSNKKKLISLEPRFPDVEAKNEWLLSQVLGIFKEAKVTPQMEGTQAEDNSNASFLATSLQVNAEMPYDAFAELLAGVENKDEYDVAVIGAGHAGCEAALAAARLGFRTVVFTVSVDSIALGEAINGFLGSLSPEKRIV